MLKILVSVLGSQLRWLCEDQGTYSSIRFLLGLKHNGFISPLKGHFLLLFLPSVPLIVSTAFQGFVNMN